MHSKDQIDLIANSIRKYGFAAPLLVDEEGVLIYGHGRHAAAVSLNLPEVPVCVAEGWTEQEKASYRIADNQIGLRADWDLPLLAGEIKELSIDDFPLDLLGFSKSQLDKFDDTLTPDVAPQLKGLKYDIIVECDTEKEQIETLDNFLAMGLKCRALIS